MRSLFLVLLSLSVVASDILADFRPDGYDDSIDMFFKLFIRKEMSDFKLREKLDRIMAHSGDGFKMFREMSSEKRALVLEMSTTTVDFEKPAETRLADILDLVKKADLPEDEKNELRKNREMLIAGTRYLAEDTPLLAKEFLTNFTRLTLSEKILNGTHEERMRAIWNMIHEFEEKMETDPKFHEEKLKIQDHVSGKKKFAPIKF